MDAIDKKILALLQDDGKRTHVEIARSVNLSPPSVLERIRKLLSTGIIRRFTVLLDPKKVGNTLTAFVHVRIADPRCEEQFVQCILGQEEVLECHRVTGDYSYLLKVKTGSTEDLNSLIAHCIRRIEGVTSTSINVVLESAKEEPGISLKYCRLEPSSARNSNPRAATKRARPAAPHCVVTPRAQGTEAKGGAENR